jgi:hypothetical protein
MLRMFAMVYKIFQVFLQMFQIHILSVSSVFKHMLQVLHLEVLKIDQVLHMLQCDSPAAATGGARGVRRGTYAVWGRVVRKVQVQEQGASRLMYPPCV